MLTCYMSSMDTTSVISLFFGSLDSSMAADDTYDDIFEHIANVPFTAVDSRTYYYMHYLGVEITYNIVKFQHTIWAHEHSTSLCWRIW